jgi:hypothetical protein
MECAIPESRRSWASGVSAMPLRVIPRYSVDSAASPYGVEPSAESDAAEP